MRLMVSRLDILAELDEAVYLFTDRARTEHKDLTYEENTSLSPVYGDRDRLRQVFVNIIDNALKYTERRGSITVSSRESARFRDGIVKIAATKVSAGVSTGIGDHEEKYTGKATGASRGTKQFEIADGRELCPDVPRHGRGGPATRPERLPLCLTFSASPTAPCAGSPSWTGWRPSPLPAPPP